MDGVPVMQMPTQVRRDQIKRTRYSRTTTPAAVWGMIFDHLDNQFFRLSLVCRDWRDVVNKCNPTRLLMALITLKGDSFGPALTPRIKSLTQSTLFQRLSAEAMLKFLGPEKEQRKGELPKPFSFWVHRPTFARDPRLALQNGFIAEAYYLFGHLGSFLTHYFFHYQLLGAICFGHPGAYGEFAFAMLSNDPDFVHRRTWHWIDSKDYSLYCPDLAFRRVNEKEREAEAEEEEEEEEENEAEERHRAWEEAQDQEARSTLFLARTDPFAQSGFFDRLPDWMHITELRAHAKDYFHALVDQAPSHFGGRYYY